MKYLFAIIFLSIPLFTYSQAKSHGTIRARSMPMSETPNFFNLNSDHFAHFSFGQSADEVNLEIALWEASLEKDSLTKLVIISEDLTKSRRAKIDILVDKKDLQIDIISIVANKMAIITPVKPEYGFIQPFSFNNSKTKVLNTIVPVILLIDTNEEIAEEEIRKILDIQDFTLFTPYVIKELKEQFGKFKLLTYHLKKL